MGGDITDDDVWLASVSSAPDSGQEVSLSTGVVRPRLVASGSNSKEISSSSSSWPSKWHCPEVLGLLQRGL